MEFWKCCENKKTARETETINSYHNEGHLMNVERSKKSACFFLLFHYISRNVRELFAN